MSVLLSTTWRFVVSVLLSTTWRFVVLRCCYLQHGESWYQVVAIYSLKVNGVKVFLSTNMADRGVKVLLSTA